MLYAQEAQFRQQRAHRQSGEGGGIDSLRPRRRPCRIVGDLLREEDPRRGYNVQSLLLSLVLMLSGSAIEK